MITYDFCNRAGIKLFRLPHDCPAVVFSGFTGRNQLSARHYTNVTVQYKGNTWKHSVFLAHILTKEVAVLLEMDFLAGKPMGFFTDAVCAPYVSSDVHPFIALEFFTNRLEYVEVSEVLAQISCIFKNFELRKRFLRLMSSTPKVVLPRRPKRVSIPVSSLPTNKIPVSPSVVEVNHFDSIVSSDYEAIFSLKPVTDRPNKDYATVRRDLSGRSESILTIVSKAFPSYPTDFFFVRIETS